MSRDERKRRGVAGDRSKPPAADQERLREPQTPPDALREDTHQDDRVDRDRTRDADRGSEEPH